MQAGFDDVLDKCGLVLGRNDDAGDVHVLVVVVVRFLLVFCVRACVW